MTNRDAYLYTLVRQDLDDLYSKSGKQAVLDHIKSLNQKDLNLALCWAAENQHSDFVKSLIKCGADATALNCLALLFAENNYELFKLLLEAISDPTTLSEEVLGLVIVSSDKPLDSITYLLKFQKLKVFFQKFFKKDMKELEDLRGDAVLAIDCMKRWKLDNHDVLPEALVHEMMTQYNLVTQDQAQGSYDDNILFNEHKTFTQRFDQERADRMSIQSSESWFSCIFNKVSSFITPSLDFMEVDTNNEESSSKRKVTKSL